MSKSTKVILTELSACSEAVKWAGGKTHKRAWETCERGDWLLWVAGQFNVDRKLLVLAACACARTALKHVPKGEERPRLAIEAAERWASDPTEKNRAAAGTAARAAAWAAWAAGTAAWTAARTAAGTAAGTAAWTAAGTAARTAAGTAAWAAGTAAQKDMAAIVRRIIVFGDIKKAIAEYEKGFHE